MPIDSGRRARPSSKKRSVFASIGVGGMGTVITGGRESIGRRARIRRAQGGSRCISSKMTPGYEDGKFE